MNIPLLKLAEPDFDTGATKAEKLISVARILADTLARSSTITRQFLTRLMAEAFGASDADGAWSMRDAYDALETAQVLLLGRGDWQVAQDDDPHMTFSALLAFQNGLPTQSYRSERQIDLQQFSTPLALAWLAAQAARITPRLRLTGSRRP